MAQAFFTFNPDLVNRAHLTRDFDKRFAREKVHVQCGMATPARGARCPRETETLNVNEADFEVDG